MQITPLFIVLIAVLSILPALIVATVCLLRIEAMRGGIVEIDIKIRAIDRACESVQSQIDNNVNRLSDAIVKAQENKLMITQIEESFRALSNKWNSRERSEKLAEKRKEREPEETELSEYEIPGTEQLQIPGLEQYQLPGVMPVQQQQQARSFGQLPYAR